MFTDGTELDRFFETSDGVVWVSGVVHVRNKTLLIDHMLIYPATGASLTIGVGAMLDILSSLKEEAISQGLSGYAVEADRIHAGKPRRIISIKRRLR